MTLGHKLTSGQSTGVPRKLYYSVSHATCRKRVPPLTLSVSRVNENGLCERKLSFPVKQPINRTKIEIAHCNFDPEQKCIFLSKFNLGGRVPFLRMIHVGSRLIDRTLCDQCIDQIILISNTGKRVAYLPHK